MSRPVKCRRVCHFPKHSEFCPVCKHPQAFFEVRKENY